MCLSRASIYFSVEYSIPTSLITTYFALTSLAPSHSPSTTSRVSPYIEGSITTHEQGPRKAAATHARNINEHGPVGISVATERDF